MTRGEPGLQKQFISPTAIVSGMRVGLSRSARFLAVHWAAFATGVLVTVGTIVRLRQWVHSRSLWLDEAALALSFDQFDLRQIITERLVSRQSAPPGFLFATELSVRLFGRNEMSLRLVALIAGLASLIVAVAVARRLLTHTIARLAFVALVALSPALVYFSNELKQYSMDVLALLVVLLLWSMRNDVRRASFMAIGGFAVSLFSLVGIVGLLATVCAFVIETWRDRRRRSNARLDPDKERPPLWGRWSLVVLGSWTLGIALHGVYTVFAGVDREWMRQWWLQRGAFPPRSLSGLEWYPQSVLRLAWIGIGDQERVGAVGQTGSLLLTGIVVVFAALAIWRRRDLRFLGISLFVLVWVLAELRIYPTSGRLSLFLVPVVFLAIAAGFEVVLSKAGRTRHALAVVGVGLLFIQQLTTTGSRVIEPRDDADMGWIAEQLQLHSLPTDEIINTKFVAAATWYGLPDLVNRGNFSSLTSIDEVSPRIIDSAAKRVWVVSTSNPSVVEELVDDISRYGYQPVCTRSSWNTYLALLLRADEVSAFDPEGDCPPSDSP